MLAVTLLITSGCTGTSSTVKEGGFLRIGTDTGIDSLNPFVAVEQDPYSAFEQIYPELVQYNTRTLAFEPDFATGWRESPDGLTWTFKTRANAKWSDGQPLTAADAAWTYSTIVRFEDGPTAAFAGVVAHMEDARATSPASLVVQYSQPVANVLSALQQIPILPEHVWNRYASGTGHGLRTYLNTPTTNHPVVSGGPFVISKYQQNELTLFQRNPNYYGPRPHIQGFGLEQFSNDDAMVSALKSGLLDAVEGVPVTAVQTLKASGLHIYVGPSLYFRDFIINSNPQKPAHRELLNPLVKEAFEYAIDRDRIIKVAWLGYGEPGTTLIPPAAGKWHDPNIRPLPFDLTRANQLLDQAGYRMGPNGVRIADGHPMSYTVIFPTDQRGPGDRAFQIIQSDFQQIGVQLIQRNLDPSAAFTAMAEPNYKYLSNDLAMWYWVTVVDPDFMLSVMTCAQYGGNSDSGYCSPAYDRLYKEQATTTDSQRRLQLVYEMQQIIYNARPYIVINYNDTIDAWSNRWAGFVESPQGFFNQLSKASLAGVHQA